MRKYTPPTQASPTGLVARLIDAFNPGVTMLLGAWLGGLSVRRYFLDRSHLSQTGYEALTSLIYVAPSMLIAWGCLVVADRVFELGLFRRDDD
jgi:hypothetical protein